MQLNFSRLSGNPATEKAVSHVSQVGQPVTARLPAGTPSKVAGVPVSRPAVGKSDQQAEAGHPVHHAEKPVSQSKASNGGAVPRGTPETPKKRGGDLFNGIDAELRELIVSAARYWVYDGDDLRLVCDLARKDPIGLRLALLSDPLRPFYSEPNPFFDRKENHV